MRILAPALIGLAALTLTACGDSKTTAAPSTSTSVAATTTPVQAASYTLHQDGKVFRVLVTTADSRALNLAYEKIKSQMLSNQPAGGYFLSFDCAYDDAGTTKAANRLANARIAVGKLGAAQTGLKEGQGRFEMNKGARCEANPQPAVTADKDAPFTEASVTDICQRRIEDEYTVEQLPITLSNLKTTTAADGRWTVTGNAQGTKAGADAALMSFTCNVWKSPTGLVMRDLPTFETAN